MAASMNRVMLMGNIGADPEIRNMNNGGKVMNLRIATSESWNDRNTGERQEKTEWHSVVTMNDKLIDKIGGILRKGLAVFVEGKLQTRKWTDKNGTDKYSTEIIVGLPVGSIQILTPKGDGGGGRDQPQEQRRAVRQQDSFEDDVPF